MITISKALREDLADICRIYEAIHDQEESGEACIGWRRGIYPTQSTAENALSCDELFVMEDNGEIVAAAIINQEQPDSYAMGQWKFQPNSDEDVMVLHTLVVDPSKSKRGFGRLFVEFYEDYAFYRGCYVLRIDTQEKNTRARSMYASLGYREADIVKCNFNGLESVHLVLLEKTINTKYSS